ncbi:hypothetical protein [Actinokineospora auranticolor]|uniref:hypothetical protein n=1 Tax=Actinokineospora auranticolor TaxID=155976 RepID=UPI0015E31C9A
MSRIADPAQAARKTDARDAFTIADDPAGEVTRAGNRIRGLLAGIHPAVENAIGPEVSHPAALDTRSRCGRPTSRSGLPSTHRDREGPRALRGRAAGRGDRDRPGADRPLPSREPRPRTPSDRD